jgi:hypothetical protein
MTVAIALFLFVLGIADYVGYQFLTLHHPDRHDWVIRLLSAGWIAVAGLMAGIAIGIALAQ